MNWKLTKDFHLKIYKLWKIYLYTLNYEKEEEKSQDARLLTKRDLERGYDRWNSTARNHSCTLIVVGAPVSRNANSRLASQTWSFGPRVASWKFDKRDDVDWGPAGVQTTRSVWILERSPGYANEI